MLAKSPVQSMDFLRQEYSLREQGGSPPRSLLQEHAVPCGSELAREEAGAVDGFSASGIPPSRTRRIATPVAPTGVLGILWEPACSRRGRCSRWIFCVRNIAFANKADRHPGRSYRSTRCLVGASLLAKRAVQSMDFLRQEYRLREQVRSYRSTQYLVGASLLAKSPVQSMDFLRQEYSLREHVRSYGSTRYLVGASLLAKRALQSMDFLRQEYSLREQVRSYRSTRYLVGASLLAKRPIQSMDFSASGIPPSRTRRIATPVAPTGARGILWERACSRRGRCSRWTFCVRNTAFANKFAPTGARGTLWERACSRRRQSGFYFSSEP